MKNAIQDLGSVFDGYFWGSSRELFSIHALDRRVLRPGEPSWIRDIRVWPQVTKVALLVIVVAMTTIALMLASAGLISMDGEVLGIVVFFFLLAGLLFILWAERPSISSSMHLRLQARRIKCLCRESGLGAESLEFAFRESLDRLLLIRKFLVGVATVLSGYLSVEAAVIKPEKTTYQLAMEFLGVPSSHYHSFFVVSLLIGLGLFFFLVYLPIRWRLNLERYLLYKKD